MHVLVRVAEGNHAGRRDDHRRDLLSVHSLLSSHRPVPLLLSALITDCTREFGSQETDTVSISSKFEACFYQISTYRGSCVLRDTGVSCAMAHGSRFNSRGTIADTRPRRVRFTLIGIQRPFGINLHGREARLIPALMIDQPPGVLREHAHKAASRTPLLLL